jgi:hypothetical protein
MAWTAREVDRRIPAVSERDADRFDEEHPLRCLSRQRHGDGRVRRRKQQQRAEGDDVVHADRASRSERGNDGIHARAATLD